MEDLAGREAELLADILRRITIAMTICLRHRFHIRWISPAAYGWAGLSRVAFPRALLSAPFAISQVQKFMVGYELLANRSEISRRRALRGG